MPNSVYTDKMGISGRSDITDACSVSALKNDNF